MVVTARVSSVTVLWKVIAAFVAARESRIRRANDLHSKCGV